VEDARKKIHAALLDLDARPDSAGAQFSKVYREDKAALSIDIWAEDMCRDRFAAKFSKDVQVVGEETLSSFTAWGPERYCILVDMVDGTDLVEMNLGLWCSAVVIYDLHAKSIIGSVVGLPTGETYYAEASRDGAWVRVAGEEYEVDGTSGVQNLGAARIAYYGQKPKNFASLATNTHFTTRLEELGRKDDGFRIYNFAGNPMMVKLCNRHKTLVGRTITNDIDVVFDLLGQQLHDVVPGAFIAMRGGAHLMDLEGQSITVEALGEALHNPKNCLSYVLAASPELGSALVNALR
jgi:fructose-1,6-bisphosphatase/inositol monophosphatase family enzyme